MLSPRYDICVIDIDHNDIEPIDGFIGDEKSDHLYNWAVTSENALHEGVGKYDNATMGVTWSYFNSWCVKYWWGWLLLNLHDTYSW